MTDEPLLHVLFVSHQAIPALVPAMIAEGADPAFPATAVLLVETPEMTAQAARIETLLRPRGVVVERLALPAATDFERIRVVLETSFLELHDQRGDRVAVNVTGGTKLMALAAFAAAQQLGWPVYYLDHDSDRILWLHDRDRAAFSFTFKSRIESVLAAHGYSVEKLRRDHVPQRRRELVQNLIDDFSAFGSVLSTFNWLCQEAHETLKVNVPIDLLLGKRNLKPLLDHFERAEVLCFRRGVLEFPDEESWRCAAGGWLEEYIFGQLAGLKGKGGLQDVATSVEMIGPGGAPNEIDVAFLVRNHLGLIECKARRLDGRRPEIGSATIDRLKALAQAGGRETYLFLCWYGDLPDHVYVRAEQEGIKIVAGHRLRQVREIVLEETA